MYESENTYGGASKRKRADSPTLNVKDETLGVIPASTSEAGTDESSVRDRHDSPDCAQDTSVFTVGQRVVVAFIFITSSSFEMSQTNSSRGGFCTKEVIDE